MDPAARPPSLHREFLRSPHHVGMAFFTLGLGLASATALGFVVGLTLYAVGWVHVPTMPFFRRWVDRRRAEAAAIEARAQVAAFVARRDRLLASLTETGRRRYGQLGAVCRDIEEASAEGMASPGSGPDPRLRKLDELMWTFLKLLGIEESLERFLETERREDLPSALTETEAVAAVIAKEVEALKPKGGTAFESRQRLWNSHLERLEVLRKRMERVEQARANRALVAAEQERLVQQVKLIRADAVATRNTDALTARIDATVEHLGETNRWLSQMDEFKDLVGDLPQTQDRLGFEGSPVPPVPVLTKDEELPPPRRGARSRRRDGERETS